MVSENNMPKLPADAISKICYKDWFKNEKITVNIRSVEEGLKARSEPVPSTAWDDGYRQISVDGYRQISVDGYRQIV
jgi:hypothetical protein